MMYSIQVMFLPMVLYLLADFGWTADVYTSLRQVKQALSSLGMYLDAMDGFIEKEEERLREIQREIETWRGEWMEGKLYDLEHPVDAYKFVARWQHLTESATDLSNFDALKYNLSTHLIPVMGSDDRIGAARAILRLQGVYNISCKVMASGVIHGRQATELKLPDMEFIGQLALEDDFPQLANGWLQLALAEIEDITATRSRILAAIGQSHYNMSHYEEAIGATQNALNLDPDNDEIAEQLKEYKQALMPAEPEYNSVDTPVEEDNGTQFEINTSGGDGAPDEAGLEDGGGMDGSGTDIGNNPKDTNCTDANANCTIDETDGTGYVNMTEDEEVQKQIAKHKKILLGMYEALCRGDQKRDMLHESTLYCRYRETDIPYARVKEEVLNFDPRIMLLYDVMTETEGHFLIDEAVPKLRRAMVGAPNVARKTTEGRVSQTSWFYDFQYNGTIKKISDRVASFTGLGTEYRPDFSMAEALQVNNYGLGGQYETHLDAFRDPDAFGLLDDYIKNTGDRLATFMFYLTDVTAGGATVFPLLNVRVMPVKGAAAFWYNLRRNGEPDTWSMHAGCPVLLGEKWVANKWIHERGQEFRRPCGLTEDDLD